MADLLTPTFFDDCEGVTSVNGTPVVDFSPILSSSGDSYYGTIGEFCETLGLTERFVRDPLSWLNAFIKTSAGVYMRVVSMRVRENSTWSLAAGIRAPEAVDYVEALTINIQAANDVTVDYYVE